MNKNLPVIIAIISGLVGGVLIYTYIQKREKEAKRLKAYLRQQMIQQQKLKEEIDKLRSIQRVTEKVPVIIAKKDIPSGEVITSDMVEEKWIPKEAKISTSAGSMAAVIGKMSKVDISKGEQVILRYLVSPLLMRKQLIPPGTRLISVSVEQLSLFRFIKPGDRVDIAIMFTLPPSQIVNVGLFSNVEIRAINGRFSYAPSRSHSKNRIGKRGEESARIRINPDKGVLTFALPPKQAAILYMASQLGKITIYPRANLDSDKERLPPVTAQTVLQYVMPQVMSKMQQLQMAKSMEGKKEKKERLVKEEKKELVRTIKIRRGDSVEEKRVNIKGLANEFKNKSESEQVIGGFDELSFPLLIPHTDKSSKNQADVGSKNGGKQSQIEGVNINDVTEDVGEDFSAEDDDEQDVSKYGKPRFRI